MSRREIFKLVGGYVKTSNLKTFFKDSVSREDWFLSFQKRHKLSLKTPQNVEYARKALGPFKIYKYFNLLKTTMDNLA